MECLSRAKDSSKVLRFEATFSFYRELGFNEIIEKKQQ